MKAIKTVVETKVTLQTEYSKELVLDDRKTPNSFKIPGGEQNKRKE